MVDAHVHLHDCFSLPEFLAHAERNFQAGARELGLPAATPGCLMLAETAGAHGFRRLRAGDAPVPHEWQLRTSAEEEALVLLRRGEPRLVLLAGRQIATRERLEVLALGWSGFLPDGEPTSAVLAQVGAAGALAVIPWGFGKWWFGRGRLVEQLVSAAAPGTLFLGDNGGRPRRTPRPPLLHLAAERQLWTLPGSDPLPFPTQVRRVASYGFFLAADADLDHPAAQIKQLIRGAHSQPIGFGQRERLVPFLRAQARLHGRQAAERWTT